MPCPRHVRRALCALAFCLLWAARAGAQTVTHRVATTSTSNTTSYASGSFTPAAGEVLFAWVGATATVASAPTMTDSQNLGWDRVATGVKNGSADTWYLFVSRATASNSSMTVTFDCTGDAATGTIIIVEGVSSLGRVGSLAVKQTAKQDNQASGGTPAPAFTSSALTGNPTLGFIFNATNPATMTTATNWTEQADVGYATPTTGGEVITRNSGFTGTTITWGSTSASAFASVIVEVDASSMPAAPAVPTLIQYRSAPSSFTTPASTTYKTYFRKGTQANNLLVAWATWGSSSATFSLADDQSNTWVAGPKITNSTDNQSLQMFYVCGAAANTRRVTGTASAAMNYMQVEVFEFNNVETSSCNDGAGVAAQVTDTSSPFLIASGNFNTVYDGDLVVQAAFISGFTAPSTPMTWTAGTGYKLRGPDGTSIKTMEYAVQSTHGGTNPALTSSLSVTRAVTATMAFKPASAGGSPAAGMWVNGTQTVMFPTFLASPSATSWTLQFPNAGDFIAVNINDGAPDAVTVTSVTSSPSATWNLCTAVSNGNVHHVWAWAKGLSASDTRTITITANAAMTVPFFVMHDISGAATSGTVAQCANHTGNSSATSGNITGGTITPLASNGLILGVQNEDGQTVTGVSPGNILSVDTGQYQAFDLEQDEGIMVYENPNTTDVTVTWVYSQYEGSTVIGNHADSLMTVAPAGGAQVGNVSETTSVSPSVGTTAGRFGSPTENLTTSPSVSAVLTASAAVSETTSVSPSVSALTGKTGSPSETLSTGDSVTALGGFFKTASESLTTSPSVSANAGRSPVVTENLTTSPSVATARSMHGDVSVSLTTADSVAGFQSGAMSRSVSEDVATTMSVTAAASLKVNVVQNLTTSAAVLCINCYGPLTENLTTVDMVAGQKNVGQATTRSVSDSVPTAAAVAALASHPRGVSESTSVADSVGFLASKNVSVSQALATSSSVATSGIFSRNVAQTLSTFDSSSAFVTSPTARGVAESLTTIATATALSVHAAGVDEITSVSLAVAVNRGLRFTLNESLSQFDGVAIIVQRAGAPPRRFIVVETP